MPLFKDPSELISFNLGSDAAPPTGEEPWHPDSEWWFRRNRRQADNDLIVEMTSKFKTRYDPRAARTARLNGQDYSAEVEQQIKMSGAVALLLVMSDHWEGPDFVVPPWAKAKNGGPDPRIGQLLPLNENWIRAMDPVVLEVIEAWLSDLYEPRTKAEQDQFRPQSEGMDGPAFDREGAGAGPVYATD